MLSWGKFSTQKIQTRPKYPTVAFAARGPRSQLSQVLFICSKSTSRFEEPGAKTGVVSKSKVLLMPPAHNTT